MAAILGDREMPVELERRLATFDEALSEAEDILHNIQKVPYSDVCAQVIIVTSCLPLCFINCRISALSHGDLCRRIGNFLSDATVSRISLNDIGVLVSRD